MTPEEMNQENEDLFGGIDLDSMNEMAEFLNERDTPPEPEETEEVKESGEEVEKKEIENTNQEQENEEEEPDKKENQEPSSQETEQGSSRLTPYFKLLVEEGLFDSETEKEWDGTTQGLLDLEFKKFNQWKEEYKAEGLDPRVKWLQDNIEEGVPFEELLKLDKETTALETIDEERLTTDPDLQKQVAEQYYKKTTRFDSERIARTIQRLEDAGELESETKAMSKELLDINRVEKEQALENAKQERINAEKQQQEVLSNFKKNLDATEEVIPGIKVNNLMRDKIFETLTTVVEYDEQSGMALNKIAKARVENPIDFEIKLAYLFELTNGFNDWSPLGATGKKRAYKDFEEAARNIDTKETKTKQTYQSDSDFLKELDNLHRQGIL